MPAYWIARSRIDDPVAYKRYTDLVPGIIKQHESEALSGMSGTANFSPEVKR